jgi:hypothetical protein
MSDILVLAEAINNLAAAISGNPTVAAPTAEPRRGPGRPRNSAASATADTAEPAALAESAPVATAASSTATPPSTAASTPPTAPTVAQTAPTVALTATKKEASDALVKLIQANKRPAVVAILASHGAKNVSELPDDGVIYGAIVNAAKEALAA